MRDITDTERPNNQCNKTEKMDTSDEKRGSQTRERGGKSKVGVKVKDVGNIREYTLFLMMKVVCTGTV